MTRVFSSRKDISFIMSWLLRYIYLLCKCDWRHVIGTVASSLLALHWMCDSPWTGCVQRTTPIYKWREQAIIEWSRWSDLGEWPITLLVNVVNSWLYVLMVLMRVISLGELYCCLLPQCAALRTMWLGLSNRNKMVLWPGCEGCARCRLHKKKCDRWGSL